MDTVQNFAEKFNEVAMVPLKYLDNNYVTAILFLIFVFYGSLAAPVLPRKVLALFDNIFVKLIFIFLIVNFYASNPAVSLFLAVIFLILISVLEQMKSLEAFTFGNTLNGAPLSEVFPDKTQVMQGLSQVKNTVAEQLQQITPENSMQNGMMAESSYNVSGTNENQMKQYGDFSAEQEMSSTENDQNNGQYMQNQQYPDAENTNLPTWQGTPTNTSSVKDNSGWNVDGYSSFDDSGKIGDGTGATRYGDYGSVNAGDPLGNTNPIPDNFDGCTKDEERQIDISKVKPFSNEYNNMDLLAEAVDPSKL